MAESVRAAGSIVAIVAFGMQLATTIHTYMDTVDEADQRLRDIVFDVNVTVSALKQLDVIIQKDKDNDTGSTVLKEEGVRDIENLASKCRQVYQNIIKLLHKANGKEPVISVSEWMINPSLPRPLSTLEKLRWPWLAPRISRCHDELRWLKISLLLALQMTNLAHLQISYTHKENSGGLDDEMDIREALQKLQCRRSGVMKALLQHNTAESSSAAEGCTDMVPVRRLTEGNNNSIRLYEEVVLLAAPPEAELTVIESSQEIQSDASQSQSLAAMARARNTSLEEVEYNRSSQNISPKSLIALHSSQALAKKPNRKSPIVWPHDYSGNTSINDQPRQEDYNAASETPRISSGDRSFFSTASFPPTSRKFPRFISKWAARIFEKTLPERAEAESGTLEAYLIDNNDESSAAKIPFNQDILRDGLKKLQKESVWSRYPALNRDARAALHKVIDSMRETKDVKRTCLVFKHYTATADQSECTIVFFSVMRKVLYFEDAQGYEYILPFSVCKEFKEMERIINEIYDTESDAELSNIHKRPLELGLQYYLWGENSKPIRESTWTRHICPASRIRMTLKSPRDTVQERQERLELMLSNQEEARVITLQVCGPTTQSSSSGYSGYSDLSSYSDPSPVLEDEDILREQNLGIEELLARNTNALGFGLGLKPRGILDIHGLQEHDLVD